jgi:hypothetical protein
MQRFLLFSTLILALSACTPPPEPIQAYDPTIDVTPGLNDKEPDLCNSDLFSFYIGRPVAEIRAAVAGKPLLILGPGTLGSQEYNASRINAFVDDKGKVYRLSCG